MRRLPCGCAVDGSDLCDQHRPQSLSRALAEEACALVSLGLFLATVAVWAAVLAGV